MMPYVVEELPRNVTGRVNVFCTPSCQAGDNNVGLPVIEEEERIRR